MCNSIGSEKVRTLVVAHDGSVTVIGEELHGSREKQVRSEWQVENPEGSQSSSRETCSREDMNQPLRIYNNTWGNIAEGSSFDVNSRGGVEEIRLLLIEIFNLH